MLLSSWLERSEKRNLVKFYVSSFPPILCPVSLLNLLFNVNVVYLVILSSVFKRDCWLTEWSFNCGRILERRTQRNSMEFAFFFRFKSLPCRQTNWKMTEDAWYKHADRCWTVRVQVPKPQLDFAVRHRFRFHHDAYPCTQRRFILHHLTDWVTDQCVFTREMSGKP